VVLLVGQGNFVATLSKALWEGQPYAQVDIFRIENGEVVEHWDNVENYPSGIIMWEQRQGMYSK